MIYFAGTRKAICIEMWLRMLLFPQLIFSSLEVLMVSFGIITVQLFINSIHELFTLDDVLFDYFLTVSFIYVNQGIWNFGRKSLLALNLLNILDPTLVPLKA